MWESKVRSQGLWASDGPPETSPLFFGCGLAVSNATLMALMPHGSQGLPGPEQAFFCLLPWREFSGEEGNRPGSSASIIPAMGKEQLFCAPDPSLP